ncbi:MAG: hypothetical protein JSW00_19325 [Thermoplasmata archaeon]|nr:MAG: hypothetical protein JSW00_19325 [Thermoplasmata archaeon]
MADRVRVTVKEKILIHLLAYTKYRDSFEVPEHVSQDGMAEAVGVRRSHIASALKDLKEKDYVEEVKARFHGQERRKNAYFLSHIGQAEALRIKVAISDKNIFFVDKNGKSSEVKISELNRFLEEKLGLLEILNRLSDDGEFQEKPPESQKEQKMDKEEERAISCPFCGKINYDFEIKTITLDEGVTGFSITCMYCAEDFIAAKTTTKDQSIPHELLAKDYLGPGETRGIKPITRGLLILTGVILASCIVFVFGFFLDAEYDLEQALIMIAVLVPIYVLLIFVKPLSKRARSELALSLGVFIVLFGAFSFFIPKLFSSSPSFSPFWVIAGAAMIMISNEIEKMKGAYLLRSLCVGAGAFIAVFCLMILTLDKFTLNSMKTASVLLWLLIGLFLVAIRFLSEKGCEDMISALKNTLPICLGMLFIFLGIVLAQREKYMECVVELFIGLPVISFGLHEAKGSSISQVGVMAFIIFSEVIAVLSFIFI